MFFKKEINPYSVSDKVTFRNVDKTLVLYVRDSATNLVVNLRKAQENLSALTDNSDECQRVNASRFFARAVFGEEQADKLVDFYNEPLAVVSAVGQYFDNRLKKLITKAQKKRK
jgi:hypothetical protein